MSEQTLLNPLPAEPDMEMLTALEETSSNWTPSPTFDSTTYWSSSASTTWSLNERQRRGVNLASMASATMKAHAHHSDCEGHAAMHFAWRSKLFLHKQTHVSPSVPQTSTRKEKQCTYVPLTIGHLQGKL